jgi:hypothetical protein
MFMDVFKSVVKTSLTSAMLFVSIVRLGMIAYPVGPVMEYTAAPVQEIVAPVAKIQVVSPQTKRRIILGQNSIKNLGQSK